MRLRGNERSAKANHGPLGSGIDGAHHASSMYEIAASTRRAARMPSPVLVGAPRVHCALLGRRWYSSRMPSSPPPPALQPCTPTPPVPLYSPHLPLSLLPSAPLCPLLPSSLPSSFFP